jgi:hypothetical protein
MKELNGGNINSLQMHVVLQTLGVGSIDDYRRR